MADETTSTPAGQTPEGQAAATNAPAATGATGDTPTPRTYSEAEIAAARRDEAAKRKLAEDQLAETTKTLQELTTWKEQQEAAAAEAADKEKSEVEKALERAQKAEQKAKDAEEAAKTAGRKALVASVVAEKRSGLPEVFQGLIVGDDPETISESHDQLMELGRLTFTPQSIGSAGNPPSPGLAAPGGGNNSDRIQRLAELQRQANTPGADRVAALREIAQLSGRGMA